MRNVRIGDVVEIRANNGLAYAYYTHRRKDMGWLIRVFKGIYQSRPSDLEEVVASEPAFSCFIQLQKFIRENLGTVVANIPLAPEMVPFPTFREGLGRPGRVVWTLWDGEKYWDVGNRLTREQKRLSRPSFMNPAALIGAIDRGYTAEQDMTSMY